MTTTGLNKTYGANYLLHAPDYCTDRTVLADLLRTVQLNICRRISPDKTQRVAILYHDHRWSAHPMFHILSEATSKCGLKTDYDGDEVMIGDTRDLFPEQKNKVLASAVPSPSLSCLNCFR